MSGQVLSLAPGSRLVFDGEVVEVVAIDGVRATVRNDRTRRFSCTGLDPDPGMARRVYMSPSSTRLSTAGRRAQGGSAWSTYRRTHVDPGAPAKTAAILDTAGRPGKLALPECEAGLTPI